MKKIAVLFVCMGNICRSPTAHSVFRHLVRQNQLQEIIQIDSAGTHAYHVGEPPDPRAQQTARQRGLDLADLRARQIQTDDFNRFDYIIAMDKDNYQVLSALCPAKHKDKLYLLMEFAPDYGLDEVPDPYYGGRHGFERVFDMVENAAQGLFEHILKHHLNAA